MRKIVPIVIIGLCFCLTEKARADDTRWRLIVTASHEVTDNTSLIYKVMAPNVINGLSSFHYLGLAQKIGDKVTIKAFTGVATFTCSNSAIIRGDIGFSWKWFSASAFGEWYPSNHNGGVYQDISAKYERYLIGVENYSVMTSKDVTYSVQPWLGAIIGNNLALFAGPVFSLDGKTALRLTTVLSFN